MHYINLFVLIGVKYEFIFYDKKECNFLSFLIIIS